MLKDEKNISILVKAVHDFYNIVSYLPDYAEHVDWNKNIYVVFQTLLLRIEMRLSINYIESKGRENLHNFPSLSFVASFISL